jgi:uncharacterized membrane protein YciS (DUF1049 family)
VVAEIYYRVQAASSAEESLGRLLIFVFGVGLIFGLAMNFAFAVWISLRLSRIEKAWTDRAKR